MPGRPACRFESEKSASRASAAVKLLRCRSCLLKSRPCREGAAQWQSRRRNGA